MSTIQVVAGAAPSSKLNANGRLPRGGTDGAANRLGANAACKPLNQWSSCHVGHPVVQSHHFLFHGPGAPLPFPVSTRGGSHWRPNTNRRVLQLPEGTVTRKDLMNERLRGACRPAASELADRVKQSRPRRRTVPACRGQSGSAGRCGRGLSGRPLELRLKPSLMEQPLQSFSGCARPRDIDRQREFQLDVARATSANPNANPGASSRTGPSAGEPRAVPLAPAPAPVGQGAGEDLTWRMLLDRQGPTDDVAEGGSDDAGSEEEEGLGMDLAQLEQFLETRLPVHPKLHRGVLANGMRFIILPNSVPPNRSVGCH